MSEYRALRDAMATFWRALRILRLHISEIALIVGVKVRLVPLFEEKGAHI